MLRKAALISLLLISGVALAGAQAEPSHPLSQITPIDVPLNMNGENVVGVNQFSIQNGLNIQSQTISDSSNTYQLKIDSNQGRFEYVQGSIDVNGNNIIQPDQIQANGDNITFTDGGNTILNAKTSENVEIPNGNLQITDPNGDINLQSSQIFTFGTNRNNLVLRGQRNNADITLQVKETTDKVLVFGRDSSQQIVSFQKSGTTIEKGDLNIPASSGNLIMNSNNIANPGLVDGIDLDNPGNAIGITGSNRLFVKDNSIRSSELDMNALSGTGISGGGSSFDAVGQQIVTGLVTSSNVSGTDNSISLVDESGQEYATTQINDDFTADDQALTSTNDVTGTTDRISIDNGNSVTIDDDFEPDTVIPDDQSLSTTSDVSGTDDRITINNGNSITVDDDFSPDTVKRQTLSEVLSQGNSAGSTSIDMNGNNIDSANKITAQTGIAAGTTNTQRDSQLGTGTVVYANGDIEVTGNIRGSGGDVAEIVPSDGSLRKGEIAKVKTNSTLTQSEQKYSTKSVGIVSTDPGITLAKNKEGVKLALTGIVPVKVTDSNGDIEPGDLITTSSKPGTGMKCRSTQKCEGAIVGKALESENQDGMVKAIVTLD